MYRLLIFLVGAAMGLASVGSMADSRTPASAYARLPDLESVRISPDGKLLAWVGSDGGQRAVQIYDLPSAKYLRPITSRKDYKLRSLEWADNETLLVTVSFSRTLDRLSVYRSADEFYRIMAFNTTSRAATFLLADLAGHEEVPSSELLRVRAESAQGAVVANWTQVVSPNCFDLPGRDARVRFRSLDCWHYGLLKVDLRSGRGRLMETGGPTTAMWFVNAVGKTAARIDWTGHLNGYRIWAPANRGWKEAQQLPDFLELRPAGLLADEAALLAIGSNGSDKVRAWRLPLSGGETSLVHEGEEDVESAIVDVHTGSAVGLRMGGFQQKDHWLDGRLAKIQSAAERAFPDKRITIESRSADYQRAVVRVESAVLAPSYYVFDFDRGTADMVGEAYPELAQTTLAETRTIRYPATDGRRIPAYLTLPAGRSTGAAPLVILLHDGLPGRDAAGFDWRVQFIASRGFAVLQPQYRGSLGFGTGHGRAGRAEWGRTVPQDVTDGIAWLREQGLANTSRVCVAGEGYGGYIALTLTVLTPESIACVASINGVTDLPSMYEYLERTETVQQEYWKDRIGPPRAYDLIDSAPIDSAARVRAPVLLIFSADDSIVPVTQTDKIAKALAKYDKVREVIELPAEDHWLSQAESRMKVLEALETLFSENLAVPATP